VTLTASMTCLEVCDPEFFGWMNKDSVSVRASSTGVSGGIVRMYSSLSVAVSGGSGSLAKWTKIA
jgi:hypothetical protein